MALKSNAVYWSIDQLPGLNSQDLDLLTSQGIYTTQDLLTKVSTTQARYSLADKLQISLKYINKWSALADLARIPSVGCQYCGALLHSGIASVAQLQQTPFTLPFKTALCC